MLPIFDPWQPTWFPIVHRIQESKDVFTLVAEVPSFSFKPGQFNMLYVFGLGEVPISISGSVHEATRLVHTVRDVGTVTQALSKLRPGEMLGLRGPFGTPWPVEQAAGGDLLVIAGGLGLAPLRSVLYYAIKNRDKFRNVILLYGARSPQELVFRAEVEQWEQDGNIDVHWIVDHADQDWKGRVGVVPALLDELTIDPLHTTVFTCGPEVMMRFGVRPLIRLGIPAERILLSMERSMKCALAFCGHCQLGPHFVCKDGPVITLQSLGPWLDLREGLS
jgi:NAD(P)H-flavin reductase